MVRGRGLGMPDRREGSGGAGDSAEANAHNKRVAEDGGENRDMSQEFDLTPDPRVLQMLGEINLPQWRCVAELIDNSIDGFVHAARSGAPIEAPEIGVALP